MPYRRTSCILNAIVGADAVLDEQSLAKVNMPNRDAFIPFPRNPK